MNFIFGVTILLLVTIVTSKPSKESSSEESSEETFYNELEACKAEVGATDMDIQQMKNHVMITTKTAKCLLACYMNKLGVMDQEKFVPEKLMSDKTTIGSNGKTISESIKDIADECKTVSDADKCESAAKIVMCLNAASKKRGFPDVF